MSCFKQATTTNTHFLAYFTSIANDINEKLFRQQIICDGERESFIVDACIVYHTYCDSFGKYSQKSTQWISTAFGRIFVVVVVVVGIAFVLTRPMLSWCFSYYVYFYAAPILLYACVLLLVFCYLFAHSIVLASFFFTLWLLLSRRCELSADEKKWIYLYFSIIVQDSHIIVLMCFASISFDDSFNPSQSLRVLSFLARISAFSITVLHRCTICVIFRKRICVRGVQSWYKLCEQKKKVPTIHINKHLQQ